MIPYDMISIGTFLWSLGIAFAAVGALITVIWSVTKDRIDSLEKRVSILSNELHEIKYNYLNRFDDMKTHISSVKEEIIEKISRLGP